MKKKKKFGIFSVTIIACAMFYNANLSQNTKSDVNLASLIAINIANAETPATGCQYTGQWQDSCTVLGITVVNCINGWPTTCGY